MTLRLIIRDEGTLSTSDMAGSTGDMASANPMRHWRPHTRPAVKVSPMSRSLSPVTTAAAAAVLAMTAFALWTGGVRPGAAETCFGPGCAHAQSGEGAKVHRSLGLIDL
jgi:hypothetical protein